MFAKLARRFGRTSIDPQLPRVEEGTEDEPLSYHQQRDVVEIAPDLLRCCSLETPFPSVAFGGYRKYYRTHPATTMFTNPSNYCSPFVNLTVDPPSLLSPTIRSPSTVSLFSKSPFKISQETERPKTPFKARRYSFSKALTAASPQLFRWKRATCIITPTHQLSPTFSRTQPSPPPPAPNSEVAPRPSFEMARSQSSTASSDSSESSPPDSIAIEFRQTTLDSEPDTPISAYTNHDSEGITIESNDEKCSDDLWSQPRPASPSSYWTAKSEE